MRTLMTLGVTAVAAVALCACAAARSPAQLADQTTRAVYDLDYDRAVAGMDDSLKAQVTRAQIGALSDGMHNLGAYHGLTQSTSNPDAGRYDYIANFDRGTMLVLLRIDPTGKVGAYRITPTTQ
ncbi:MAG: hypothetical protein JO359_00400 [Candidatus Eremiobacteraeota bacterium]|nr:hypothetical protein [Candidatus Eremiobacteraeota bacterium]